MRQTNVDLWAATAQSIFYGLCMLVMSAMWANGVSTLAWCILFFAALACSFSVSRLLPKPATVSRAATWFFNCLLGALLFSAADAGLDILKGADRPKADVAAYLGGLEMWFVLCPGLASVAIFHGVKAFRSKPPNVSHEPLSNP